MEKKQTAVEWLIERLEINNSVSSSGEFWNILKSRAKAMEKEQIEEAFNNSSYFIDGKEYYDDTYGN